MPAAPLIDRRSALLGTGAILLAAGLVDQAHAVAAGVFEDVRRHGARGDGVAIDSPAINRAIEAAAKRGGGTVVVPAGRYLCFTLRLRDNIALVLSAGATIVAADPDTHGAHYDPPENYLEEQFQDFGITHVHNSLISGDGVSNVAILGPGMLHGLGLDREGPGDRWHGRAGWQSAAALGITPRALALRDEKERAPIGRANKTIGLMRCRNFRLQGFTILQAGHFGVIAHGCSNLQIEGLVIDTDRDGIDIDACRDVRIVNCTVNAPKDDAIVLKSSYALGRAMLCEDVLISGCKTSGYAMGSLLDGSYRPSDYLSPDKLGPLGRIKLGTETNGGFRNIRISDCICTNSRGILMGIVDGGTLEDVSVSGILLRDPVNHPLFVHHAARMRAPRGTPVGRIRGVRFQDVTVSGAHPRFPCGVEGIADAPVEDVIFRDIDIAAQGGGTREDAARDPEYRRETSLEVSYLGTLPAAGFYARHARRLTIRNVSLRTAAADARPVVALRNVDGGIVDGIASPMPPEAVLDSRDSRAVALGKVTRWGD
ncbi:rhamnogalacturonidase [Sphingomonas hengshuiensis]|uniref:rhamnogalacturonidase n=1 Tax=Sphingomonas hengshuiensis TaxID=1609977 RepID=UPI0006962B58|nr:glycosyl hydrolase family 28-related protein [Sphingomonas hengshuiensis]